MGVWRLTHSPAGTRHSAISRPLEKVATWLTELLVGASREDEEDGNLLARSNLEAKPILMRGVAPHMCDKSACTLLDRKPGVAPPRFL